jgi:hypothetical protein
MAREVVIGIHRMTLKGLPKLEMFEEGCQIRRSAKSFKSNIIEGYGRRGCTTNCTFLPLSPLKGDFQIFLFYWLPLGNGAKHEKRKI